MDQMEISLLILRHLAREGCKDSIRAYMNECPAVKPVVGVQTDIELFRQKLLNRSLSLSLTELLSEYSRAKSTIQELTSKLLYEWNALSTLYLSPHDSMATQLAHIAQLLETKCKRVTMDSKCVGTSDDPDVVPPILQEGAKKPVQCARVTVEAEVQTDAIIEDVQVTKVHAEVQTGAADAEVQTGAMDAEVQTGTVATEDQNQVAGEPETEEPEEGLPDIVESLLEPQNLDKMVEIANKELNRSSQSTHENVLNNDTEAEIDKMLLDILHGIGPGSSIPNSALNEGCSSSQAQSDTPVGVADSQVQLMELFQDAQSVIVNTPIAGTLGHPEDSASKQPKQYTSFLDLIDTPFKNAFVSNPSTPITKPSTSTSSLSLEVPAEKAGLKTVALDFGPVIGSLAPAVSAGGPVPTQITLTKARSSGPRYSIVQQCKTTRDDLDRLRRRRDITPRIPTSITSQVAVATSSRATQSSDGASSSVSVLLRSASKRKFTTPVKLSPAKALLSTVHFYCPSSSLEERRLSTPINASRHSDSMETPHKSLTVTPKEKSTNGTDATLISKSPLVTINYDDLLGSSTANIGKKTAAVALPLVQPRPLVEPSVQQQPVADPLKPVVAPATPHVQENQEVTVSVANMTTPDSRLDDQRRPEECLESSRTPHMYNRLLASVRHSRPITVVNKKSYSTPRKKGHIRNLMFKTPPGAQHDKISELFNVDEEPPVKRKRTPTPPPGSKSRKRLKWNSLIKSTNESDDRVECGPTPKIIPQATLVATAPQVQVPDPPSSSAPLLTPSGSKEGPQQPKPVPASRSKVSMAEVASKVVSKVSISTRTRGSTVKPQSQKTVKKVTQQEEDDSPKLVNAPEKKPDPLPPTSAPNRRRRSKRMEEQLAAEAAAVSAVPLGNRGNSRNDQRVTRKTRSTTKSSPEEPRNQYWLPSSEVQVNAEPVGPPPSFVDSSCRPSPPKVSQSNDLAVPVANAGASISSASLGWPNMPQSVHVNDVSRAESQPNGETSHVSIPQKKELSGEISHPRTRQRRSKTSSVAAPNITPSLELMPPVSATPSPRLEAVSASTTSTRFTTLQRAKAFPNLSSSLEKSHELSLTDKGKSATDSSASTSTASTPSTSTKSPSIGRPKSPRKSPQKGTPRRILPKPVPPDHPLPPVFPPPLPSPGYVLSIPSNTPTKDGDVFSSISVMTSSPIPPPSIVVTAPSSNGKGPALSSSDSSSEVSVTSSSPVPMTPRLRPDPGEESSMHTRMFPDTSCGPGVPIFSSTPLKFGPPATPGKNILNTMNPAVTNVMNESGECSRGSSLFDTPVKMVTAPVVATVAPVMATPPKSTKTPPRATSSSRQTRKSPRKVKTPTKQPKPKTPPRKAKTPVKSAQKAGAPQSFEYKPTKRTPYRSPLSKKNSPSEGDQKKHETPASTKDSSKAQQATPATKVSQKLNEAESSRVSVNTEANPNSSFPSVCTKSKSFLRLAEIARRGRASSTLEPATTSTASVTPAVDQSPASKSKSFLRLAEIARRGRASSTLEPATTSADSVTPVVDQSPASKSLQQPSTMTAACRRGDTTVTKENNEKAPKVPEAHFQFAVSGRAKQLSLSEHETLLGLLQMGSVKTQLDIPQTVQRPESNLLSGIDVFQFLKKVHQAE